MQVTINNLMTAVLGNAELLSLNLNQPQAAEMLDAVARSALRASTVVKVYFPAIEQES